MCVGLELRRVRGGPDDGGGWSRAVRRDLLWDLRVSRHSVAGVRHRLHREVDGTPLTAAQLAGIHPLQPGAGGSQYPGREVHAHTRHSGRQRPHPAQHAALQGAGGE